MGLLQKVKSLLGLGDGRRPQSRDRPRGNTEVTVERQPATGSENAVKGTEAGADAGAAGGSAQAGEVDVETAASASDEADETGEGTGPADADSAAETDAARSGADDADAAAADSPPVQDLEGIGAAYSDRLGEASIETVADLAAADAATLSEETGISEKRLRRWIDAAQDY